MNFETRALCTGAVACEGGDGLIPLRLRDYARSSGGWWNWCGVGSVDASHIYGLRSTGVFLDFESFAPWFRRCGSDSPMLR